MRKLTEEQFDEWSRKLSLSPETVALIQENRHSPPSRAVQGGAHNMHGNYPSPMIGLTNPWESHTVELRRLKRFEFDPDVLEVWAQARAIRLRYTGPSGKLINRPHWPDAFVLRNDSAGWEEQKTEDELNKKGHLYQRDANGGWFCPAGNEYARPFGLYYRVNSSATISANFHRNAECLDDFLRCKHAPPSEGIAFVQSILRDNGAMTLADLVNLTRGRVDEDGIYQMLAISILHFDWDAAPLKDPEHVYVFADKESMTSFFASRAPSAFPGGVIDLQAGKPLNWDGAIRRVINVGMHNISLSCDDGSVVEVTIEAADELIRQQKIGPVEGGKPDWIEEEIRRRLLAASPEELRDAARVSEQVRQYIAGEVGRPPEIKERTFRGKVAAYRYAKETLGFGLLGVLTRIHDRGNPHPHNQIADEVRTAMDKDIQDHFEKKEQSRVYEIWTGFGERSGLQSPTYQTYLNSVHHRNKYQQTKRRKGKRAAYSLQPWCWRLTESTPRHGDRPFEIGHIDHTQIDLVTRSENPNVKPARLWLTTLTDAYTRRILAIYLSYDRPSYRSCMMVIRECVRRFRRLPQNIVVDGGKEFKSLYFDATLAFLEVTKKVRPPAESRYGSTEERPFGTANTTFFYNLIGNTQGLKTPRQTTKSNDPYEHALWTFPTLAPRLEEWAYEKYDILVHPALGTNQSPRDAFNEAMRSGPPRKHRYLQYNRTFILLTSPTTPKGTARVLDAGLVNVNYIKYFSDQLLDAALLGQDLPVRYDPWDVGVAWVYAHRMWVECHSEHYAELQGKSERLIMIIVRRIRERNKLYPLARLTVNAATISQFLKELHADEEVLEQMQHDLEAKKVRDRLFGPASQPPIQETQAATPVPAERIERRRRRKVKLCEVRDGGL
jgi:hypothetical protein